MYNKHYIVYYIQGFKNIGFIWLLVQNTDLI